MNIEQLNIACIQLLASGEISGRHPNGSASIDFLEKLALRPGLVKDKMCDHWNLFMEVQFVLLDQQGNVRSPYFLLQDIRGFEKKESQTYLLLSGVRFEISQEAAESLEFLKTHTPPIEFTGATLKLDLILKKVAVLKSARGREIIETTSGFLSEKEKLIREYRYEDAAKLRDKEKDLWNELEKLMVEACGETSIA